MSSSSSTTTITKPEIEVVHQPDQEFLEKKGVCKYTIAVLSFVRFHSFQKEPMVSKTVISCLRFFFVASIFF